MALDRWTVGVRVMMGGPFLEGGGGDIVKVKIGSVVVALARVWRREDGAFRSQY